MKYAAVLAILATASAAFNLAPPTAADLAKLKLPSCGMSCTVVPTGCDPKKIKDANKLYKCRCSNDTFKKAVTACLVSNCKNANDLKQYEKLNGVCKAYPPRARIQAILDILQEPVDTLKKRQGEDESPLSMTDDESTIEARSPQEDMDMGDDVETAVMPEEGAELTKRQYPWGNGAYYQGDTQSVQINRLPGATPVVDDTSVYLNGGPGYTGYGGFGGYGSYGGFPSFGGYGGYGFH